MKKQWPIFHSSNFDGSRKGFSKDCSFPDYVWEELNKRFTVVVAQSVLGRYRVEHKIFQRTEMISDNVNEVEAFYIEEAEKIEKELEKIILG